MDIIEKICKELLSDTNVIKYETGLSGQKIVNDVIVIGGRVAHLKEEASSLCHELGHFAEIDDDRVNISGWGLQVRTVWVYDRYCLEPMTRDITERELRVCAYQAHLHNLFGITEDIEETVSSLEFLADTLWVPIETGEQPYSENKTHNLDYKEIKESQHKWRMNRLEELKSIYTLNRFMAEFQRKVKLLEKCK